MINQESETVFFQKQGLNLKAKHLQSRETHIMCIHSLYCKKGFPKASIQIFYIFLYLHSSSSLCIFPKEAKLILRYC